jgi:hypothetical protein
MLYSYNGEFPEALPFRIVLSDGFTRTDPTSFTDEEIADAGYVACSEQPTYDKNTQTCDWDSSATSWVVGDMTQEEIDQITQNNINMEWETVKEIRNRMINDIEWRVHRYNSEVRLGLTPTDDITELDTYIQALRDISNQEDPFNIDWPNLDQEIYPPVNDSE